MVEKPYDWADGAILEEHSRRKHKILREYFFSYLIVRCKIPLRERFRLAVIDGFSGGGRYRCGTVGSPLIFLEELKHATEAINLRRVTQGLGPIDIQCLLIFNDDGRGVVDILKTNVAPLHAEIEANVAKLHLRIEYLNEPFATAYPKIKDALRRERYSNVLFNLDQCGHSDVDHMTLVDIMQSYPSAEIFYTFAINALLAFLRKSQPDLLAAQLAHTGISTSDLAGLDGIMTKKAWLGAAERLVFETFKHSAPFVSPFSINNPDGWRYWLIHFANFYRARQVYNDILHRNSTAQAHFGRSGLRMLSYNPTDEGSMLYLFDELARRTAKEQLLGDIPRLISDSGNILHVADFYEGIYNATPAHTDDIHTAIIENPDIDVITPTGGKRLKSHTITVNDVLKLKHQKSFFPMFFKSNTP